MVGYTFCSNKIDIPPGDKRHTIIISSRVKADVHLYTVVPHAHDLCREFRLAATFADGTAQPLLWIKDWDLDWQDQYRYLKPVRLPKGTLLTLAVFFDNTEDNPAIPTSPRAASARPGYRRRDVRLPPGISSRRPQRLCGLPREVAVRALTLAYCTTVWPLRLSLSLTAISRSHPFDRHALNDAHLSTLDLLFLTRFNALAANKNGFPTASGVLPVHVQHPVPAGDPCGLPSEWRGGAVRV